MQQPFKSSVGVVMSADIAVPDHERVKQFYTRVLCTGNEPLWQEDLMNNLGIPIIGLGEQKPEYAKLPLQWMPHIQVADVAYSLTQAQQLGGRELMHGKDDQGHSQWAVIEDPNGAAFGLVPKVTEEMLPKLDDTKTSQMGTIAWLDLTVTEAESTRDFYQSVIGWQPEDVAMKNGDQSYADFSMLDADGHAAAGVCHARGANAGLPAVWLIYLPVGDLTASLEQVKINGGQIIHQSQQTVAVIQDPVGVYLALAQI